MKDTDPFCVGADSRFLVTPDWRKDIEEDQVDNGDPDKPTTTPDDVVAILGFDPAADDAD